MRYLAIDLGEKRTGLAIGDDAVRVASPLSVIETSDANKRLERICDAVEEHDPGAVVIGLPLNMDGSEGEAAARVRAFGELLAGRVNLPIHYADERLSSEAANDRMSQSGLTHAQKKSRRDALAAAAFLQPFLDDL